MNHIYKKNSFLPSLHLEPQSYFEDMISEIESIASPLNTYLFSTVIEMLNSKEGSHIHFGYEIPTAFTLLAEHSQELHNQ